MRSLDGVAGDAAGRPARAPAARPGVPAVALVVLAVLGVAVILGAIGAGFLMDDWFLLGRTSLPLSWEALRFRLATEEHRIVLWVHPGPLEIEFFRPIVMLSLWLERRLWGLDPRGYHAVNALLHAASTGLLYLLYRRLGLRPAPGALAALGWGLGLVATTPLVWIAARTESVCALFSFAGALVLLRWRDGAGHGWLGGAVLLAALAAGAKETGLLAPFLWLLAARLTGPGAPAAPARRIRPAIVALLLLPASAALAVRLWVLRLPLPPPSYFQPLGTPLDVVHLALELPLQLLFWLLSVPVSHLGPLDWLVARPLVALVALVALAALLVSLHRAAGGRALRFGLGWAAVALFPVLPLVPTTLYAYQPLAGLAWLLGAAWQRSGRRRYALWLGGWIVLGTLATGTALAFDRHVSRRVDRALQRLVGEARRRHAERVLLVDAPVWTYGIAPQLSLQHPDLRLETWFVDFAPDLRGLRPSRVEWSGPNELVVRSAGGFFRSPIERFLAFGGTPERAAVRPGAPVAIRALEPGPYPRALSVRFRDREAMDSSLLLRFRRAELLAIPVPLNARAHAGRLPPSPTSPPARTPSAASGARSSAARPSGPAPAWARTSR